MNKKKAVAPKTVSAPAVASKKISTPVVKRNVHIPAGAVPMGTIIAFALSIDFIPAGWLLCDGSVIAPKYKEFIKALGRSTTPNLAGRTLVGTGTPTNQTQTDGKSPQFDTAHVFSAGNTGGEYQNILSESQMPSHQHFGWGQKNCSNWGGDSDSTSRTVAGGYKGAQNHDSNNYLYGSSFSGGTYGKKLETENNSLTGLARGNTAAHNNMPPYYAINYIIYTGHHD